MLRRIGALLIGVVLLLGALAPAVFATPEKAKQTGKDCKGCHANAGPHANWYHK